MARGCGGDDSMRRVGCTAWFTGGALPVLLACLIVVASLLTPAVSLADGYSITTLVQGIVQDPWGVAVDTSGNVYVADSGQNAIKEWVKGSGTVATIVGAGLNGPEGI